MDIRQRLAEELGAREQQIDAAVRLLDEGATVPFVARYRKEVTGGLDDSQLRLLEERLSYLRELEERREVVLKSIEEQGKLTADLKTTILAADSKTRLEDLYLPYRPKRRTKAQIAREAGLQPLAKSLLEDPQQSPEELAESFINSDKGIADTKSALDGARQILMEEFAEDAELIGRLRDYLWDNGVLESRVLEDKSEAGAKFSDYFEYQELIKKIPSHRALALLRGRNEGVLALNLTLGEQEQQQPHPCESMIARQFSINDQGRAADQWLKETVRWAWRVKIFTHLDLELKQRMRESAEEEAIRVFASNLHDLLLAAPAGLRPAIGLDPGLRTGVKVAVVDATGQLVSTATIYPHVPQKKWDEAIHVLAGLARQHKAELISIGNGTASRETDQLASDLIKRHPELRLQKLVVSEAGASVYSASELATQELPDIDVSLRGAVSIARRLQDPLAELVKIDPKSIGVGQYQHDVSQSKLMRSLDAVVEDCVNAVGVDVNSASPALLARVSGLNTTLARNIVEHRNQHGVFAERKQLLKVPRLGDKTFEQAAGFLRISQGSNPLDRSAVHPEAYPVVERIIKACGRPIESLLGDSDFLRRMQPKDYIDERFGLPTVQDILSELEKPGRDPRPEFKTATFKEGVETLQDLRADMILEGVVTNVTNFGAFIDIGVHQDGLVHISALADKFVKDPREVVKTGDLVKVKVMEVDLNRKRIALTMRLNDDSRDHISDNKAGRTPQPGAKPKKPDRKGKSNTRQQPKARETQTSEPQGALADAFRRALK